MNAIPDYEGMLERFYRGLLREGDTCVDVGAHVGRHTWAMLECIGPRGRIVAFEPIPSLADALAAEVARRGVSHQVEVHGLALSDSAGSATFVITEDAPGYSGLRRRVYDVPTRTREIEVRVDTLDAMVADRLGALAYIKVDAEGAEWAILRGAQRALARFRPVVTFEFGEASYGAYGVDPGTLHDMFAALDYRVCDIRGRELAREAFCESSRHQALWDYVGLPRERDAAALLAPLQSVE
jgi:FkbM family methyltransferase